MKSLTQFLTEANNKKIYWLANNSSKIYGFTIVGNYVDRDEYISTVQVKDNSLDVVSVTFKRDSFDEGRWSWGWVNKKDGSEEGEYVASTPEALKEYVGGSREIIIKESKKQIKQLEKEIKEKNKRIKELQEIVSGKTEMNDSWEVLEA